jgi:hypothetical protein
VEWLSGKLQGMSPIGFGDGMAVVTHAAESLPAEARERFLSAVVTALSSVTEAEDVSRVVELVLKTHMARAMGNGSDRGVEAA